MGDTRGERRPFRVERAEDDRPLDERETWCAIDCVAEQQRAVERAVCAVIGCGRRVLVRVGMRMLVLAGVVDDGGADVLVVVVMIDLVEQRRERGDSEAERQGEQAAQDEAVEPAAHGDGFEQKRKSPIVRRGSCCFREA